MKKKMIKVVVLIALTTFTIESNIVFAANNSTIQNQINNNQNQIDKLEQEKDKVNEQTQSAKSELDKVLGEVAQKNLELSKSNESVQGFQSKIDELQGQINTVENQINTMNNEIAQKEQLIIEKEAEAIEREEMLGTRLRGYYKNGFTSQMLNVIFNSDGLGSLISNVFSLNKLVNMDNELLEEVQAIQEQLEKDKVSLNEEMDKLNVEKESINNKKAELVQAQKEYLDEKNKYEEQINELKRLEDQKQGVVNSLSNEERELQSKIGELNDYNQTLQSEMDSIFDNINGGSNVDGSVSQGQNFKKPTSGYISSAYGPRKHPVTGAQGFHTGVDFAAPKNTPIVASKSGTVVTSTFHYSYGNYIIVDHGGGVQTLYAHANKLLVSKGQQVSQGQQIALVGTTGSSTGDHLHFEVRINGKHTNPMNYL